MIAARNGVSATTSERNSAKGFDMVLGPGVGADDSGSYALSAAALNSGGRDGERRQRRDRSLHSSARRPTGDVASGRDAAVEGTERREGMAGVQRPRGKLRVRPEWTLGRVAAGWEDNCDILLNCQSRSWLASSP